MVFLGIMFDTVKMVMEVTPERVQDTLEEVARWVTKENTSQKELQVLLVKLHFVCKCVRQGRVFVSRLLNLLRETSEGGVVSVGEEARVDIRWYFRSEFPARIGQDTLHISALEMLAVVLAVRVWGHHMGRAKIRVYCDNGATVQVINSGKTRDAFMQRCLREICYLTAKAQCIVRAVHQNRLPDLLSRWSLSAQVQDKFYELTAHRDMVIPLYKKGDNHLFDNYRPISLLSTVSKIFEKTVLTQVYNYFCAHKLFYESQYGFWKCHSTELAAIELVDRLSNYLDAGKVPVSVFLDLSKAFDTLNHTILIEKLRYYGLNDTSLNWFHSYLHDRLQFTEYNSVCSDVVTLSTGVPQGSILGPLLFIIYMNDIQAATSNLKLFCMQMIQTL